MKLFRGEIEGTMRNFRKQLAKIIIKYPFVMIFSFLAIFLFIPYLLLGILHFLEEYFLEFDWCFLSNFIVLQDGAEGWFSFFGSYLSVIATIIVALITLRLDLRISKDSRATDINKLTVQEIRLYDLWRDFTPSVLKSQDVPKRFALQLIFNKYEPYYSINIKHVYWERITGTQEEPANHKKHRRLKNNRRQKSPDEIEFQNVQIKNPSCLEEYIYFDDKETTPIENTFNYFYRIHCYEPIMMSQYDKQRCLRLDLSLHNLLFKSHPEKIDVVMKLTLENGSYEGGYMKLDIKNYNLTIR